MLSLPLLADKVKLRDDEEGRGVDLLLGTVMADKRLAAQSGVCLCVCS